MGNYVNADPKALRSLANQIGYSGEAIRIECQHLKEAIDELRPTIDDETYRRIDRQSRENTTDVGTLK